MRKYEALPLVVGPLHANHVSGRLALISAIFAAAVVEISHFGLGGEAPIIIYSARDHGVVVINGQGSAPKAATPQLFAGKDAIPGNGPLGATLPAAVDSAAIRSQSSSKHPTVQPGDRAILYASVW